MSGRATAAINILLPIMASAWLGIMLTIILHTRLPLSNPGAVWIATSCSIWLLTEGRAALRQPEEKS